jgi:hypothetical protein
MGAEYAWILRVMSPVKMVVGLDSGAVVTVSLDRPVDLDEFQSIRAASALQPAYGWVTLGPYDMGERVFTDSWLTVDTEIDPPRTTEYQRVAICY